MFVKPAPGLTIVDPDLKDFLPPEGRDVPETDYWHRMWLAGDVTKPVADSLQASAQPGAAKPGKTATATA